MKLIISILILIFCSGVKAGGIETDKVLHFGVSAVISGVSYQVYKEDEVKNPKLMAFAITMFVGVAKELTDDKFDTTDLLFDAAGAATPLLFTWEF